MRIVIWIVFALSFLVLNICLLVPNVSYNMKWSEAAIGIVPGALVALICFALLVAGVGAKRRSRFRAPGLWAVALLWGLLMGGFVIYNTTSNYDYYMFLARSRRESANLPTAYGQPRSSVLDSYLDEARARDSQTGTIFGYATLGFAGVSLVGLVGSLIISFALRKNPQDNASVP